MSWIEPLEKFPKKNQEKSSSYTNTRTIWHDCENQFSLLRWAKISWPDFSDFRVDSIRHTQRDIRDPSVWRATTSLLLFTLVLYATYFVWTSKDSRRVESWGWKIAKLYGDLFSIYLDCVIFIFRKKRIPEWFLNELSAHIAWLFHGKISKLRISFCYNFSHPPASLSWSIVEVECEWN